MADQGMLIHQMTVKGKRLFSGLEKFVTAFAAKDSEATEYAYCYALGCLGGDYLTKRLMKTKWLGKVVDELVANKLMKSEKGDKLKGEWKENFVPEEESKPEGEVEEKTEYVLSLDSCLTTSAVDEEGETTSPLQQEKVEDVVSEPDREAPKEDLPKVVEPTNEEIREFSFTYNWEEKNANQELVPRQMIGVFYDILDCFSASLKLAKSIYRKGEIWKLTKIENVSDGVQKITYRRGTAED